MLEQEDNGGKSDYFMAVAAAKRKLTYADFERIPDDGLRHEIIDGEHFVSPPPNHSHQVIAGNLHLLLGNHVRAHALGEVLFAPFAVRLSEHDAVEPDLMFIASGHQHLTTERHFAGGPDLVIEVLSPSTRRRDQNLKRKRYELFGVGEYWMIDPVAQTVAILRRNAEATQFDEVAKLSSASFRTPLLPGLQIPLSEIFRT
jgi:Uma2 family endonuclease